MFAHTLTIEDEQTCFGDTCVRLYFLRAACRLEEEGDDTHAGMRTDDGTDEVYHHIFRIKACADLVCKGICLVCAICVGDVDGLLCKINTGFFQLICKLCQRSGASAHFPVGHKATLVVYPQDRFYAEHAPDKGLGCRDSAAAL